MSRLDRSADGVERLRTLMVNLYFVVTPIGARPQWVMVDAGLRGYASRIKAEAEHWFGRRAKPEAIVLTHGHFDHVGGLLQLASAWDVPVYAHPLELPYLTGRSAYPPPDPLVGGGAMAWISRLYPRAPLDLGHRVRPLAENGLVEAMPGWRWLHTPGHTRGHVSLFRESDRTLIAGDAVTTVKQESMLAVMRQKAELHGPPAYYTSDWGDAARSVRLLADLEPNVLATGHGRPLEGPEMREALRDLALHFEERAVPPRGRYVRRPAIADARGVVALPPDPLPRLAQTAVVASVLGAAAVTGVLAQRGREARHQRAA